jgi:hypothetical protein
MDIGSLGQRGLDLRRIRFYVINCPEATERRSFMAAQLERLGLDYELVNCIPAPPWSRLSVALSHLKILARGDVAVPFAILEDDCELTDNLTLDFSPPVETDALYLGVSHFGIRTPGTFSPALWRKVRWVRFDNSWLRVFNMLARHAIVYLSEQFRVNAIQASVMAMTGAGRDVSFNGDTGYAMLQATHLVLTPHQPMCRQTELLGGQQSATEHPLDYAWPDPPLPGSELGV